MLHFSSLNAVSRLKGIETFPQQSKEQQVALRLNAVSRLKGIETLSFGPSSGVRS